VLCDGLRADTAVEQLGYVEALCHHKQGARWSAVADSPSVSRTNYETISTGMPSVHHGFVTNLMHGKSKMKKNMFTEVKAHGGTSAVIGSSWFYDLYGNDAPFVATQHKEINDRKEPIQIGRYQSAEEISTQELLETTSYIIDKFNPDLTLVHVQDIDHLGHTKGIGREYIQAVEGLDELLGVYMPHWLKNHTVVICADHGMDSHRNHGGMECSTVKIPFYILGKHVPNIEPDKIVHQTDVARIVLHIMGIHGFEKYQEKIFKSIHYVPMLTCRNDRTIINRDGTIKQRSKAIRKTMRK